MPCCMLALHNVTTIDTTKAPMPPVIRKICFVLQSVCLLGIHTQSDRSLIIRGRQDGRVCGATDTFLDPAGDVTR